MNVVEAALRRIADDLARHQQSWALVGGFAVSARAEPRFTHRLATARPASVAAHSDGDVVVDVLFASSGIEPEIVAAAELIEITPGLVPEAGTWVRDAGTRVREGGTRPG